MKFTKKKMVVICCVVAFLIGISVAAVKANNPEFNDKQSGIDTMQDADKIAKSDVKDEDDGKSGLAEDVNNDGNNTTSNKQEDSNNDSVEVTKETSSDVAKHENTQASNVTKPSTDKTTKPLTEKPSKPSTDKPSKPSTEKPSKPNKPVEPEKPTKPAHTHTWVEQTQEIHHPATGHEEQVLVKAAWTEKVPVYETVAIEVCNACGADITANPSPHMKAHALKGENAARHTEYVQKQTGTNTISHPAEYTTKWVQDQAAWTEKKVVGYKCSCGATK